ncbi:MAG TPA: response regulator [Gemmatimonadales bacterium]|nr:response regulator [Gemmatimonadales bacterium]
MSRPRHETDLLEDHGPPRDTPPEGQASASHALPGRGELIVVVDDDDILRRAIARMLKSLGFSVLTAADGADAVTVIESCTKPIDALLVDVVMPHLSGPELVERLASRGIHIGVIYMSGYDDATIVTHLMNSPTVPLLRKPFTPQALMLVLREVLSRRGTRQPNGC